MDYGHRLEFGAFLTPAAANPEAPVLLSQVAEASGLDLVTFQDHPYQPAFLDTWTLMSFVAARTERIRIAPNVLNIPLRPPAVIARAAASLDLLSGGRFELGLGAGGFWDAIEAMGGTRLTPGQAVTALGEAIDVIRELWDTEERRGVFTDGTYHRVHGAKRGPRPAHSIPILIGAYKPRMLALTGRQGDGWLPSLGYMQPGDLGRGNAAIDEAAASAGRDPREIRRLLNIGVLAADPREFAERIAQLAIEDGISTFILAGDDPRLLRAYGEEVAPAARELVERERAANGTAEVSARSAAALSARREGIAYDDVPAGLVAIEPGDFGYADVRATYMRGGRPGIVLQPDSPQQVADAVAFARRHPTLPLSVRSGGHGISGRSTNDGGIVIDLRHLNAIEVLDEARRLVRIGPGARWMEVAAALGEHGWALSSGDYGGVGVGGLATAGGIGFLAREHGLTIDHLRAAQIVLADGSIVRTDAQTRPDLFWAIRGAGSNIGIVTSFEFEVDEIGEVGWATLALQVEDTAEFLEGYGRIVEASPRDLTAFLLMGGRRPGQPQVAQLFALVDSDDPDTIIARLQPFAELGPIVQQSVQLTTYAQVMANADLGPQHGSGEPYSRSALVAHITPGFAEAAERMLEAGDSSFFQLRSVGGAVADIPEGATAYAHRSANFSVVALGSRGRLDASWEALAEHTRGMYLSFDSTLRPERIDEAFPPATLARLRAIKAEVDPHAIFVDNFAVGTEQDRGSRLSA
ncbi:LLM class flavin-dependent oxidoreductase [Microbacterium pygmaeum]|uniref:Flavin-dependent oxidoreductase, luciferase family (Includes alkanesulfonate monooxygenase SsuD and methylene tetrahydromethanopterin reductase) n=1 Tax=Microbacterium pygmaeum TaxID=370764 RepID=A0A1G7U7G5_9MICO|nr:LLM class flavin-dependent oxidoreductase [Microbacterium pygmaeum]SDG43318.1 Flavin-dependent oxidoreductase, luciferase family (includes alkanesulfonate monooxygenase SsuD and methylene tetrahydromethanopterin reductase) [Microbacterium pygmaeum]